MIEFINFKQFSNPNQSDSWKTLLKIGFLCIFIGYIIFILKELIVGFISLIFFVIGLYCLYLACKIWKRNNQPSMKKLLSKFKNLSTIKKIALIIFVLFGLFWYWATNAFYYYIIHTLGIPQLSSFTGISVGTIDWILYRFPIYFKIISIIIFFPIILLIIFKKKRKNST